jgi:hypothetical protein
MASEVYLVIFFEMPFRFYFPTLEFCLLLTFCIGTSLLTTYYGLEDLVNLPITRTLKGLV